MKYIYKGKKVVFTEEVSDFLLSDIIPYEFENQVFIGWLNNGTAAKNTGSYKIGDTLTAAYADMPQNLFYIKNAEIKTNPYGLIFNIVKKSEAEKNIGGKIIEYGALFHETDLTSGHTIKYGETIYNEYAAELPENVYPTVCEGGKNGPCIIKEASGNEKYTFTVLNIPKEKYNCFYTVRGYIRFYDINGNIRTAYTRYFQTSLYKEAKNIGNSDITDYFENEGKEIYFKNQYESRKNLKNTKKDCAPLSWLESEGSAKIEGIKNKDFYELKNGIQIREVEYNLAGRERKPVEIIQFGDTHLNYINDFDRAQQSACILSTYKGREWNRDGASVPNINKVMEYTAYYKHCVITGDILDYFSNGCCEMTKKLILDKKPDVLMAMGNHEYSIHMQDIPHKCDTEISSEKIHGCLEKFWPNDMKYESRLIKNEDGEKMVFIAVMDNGAHRFVWDICEKFENDIKSARVQNIPMLLFMHCPISVNGGEKSEKFKYFYEPGDISGCKEDGALELGMKEAGSGEDELDKRVYSLITENADVVRGIFCGDYHNNIYTEVKGCRNGNKSDIIMIPQYVSTANAYGGRIIKIIVK